MADARVYVFPTCATDPVALNRIQCATGRLAVIDGERARLVPMRVAAHPGHRAWHATAGTNDDYTPPPAAA